MSDPWVVVVGTLGGMVLTSVTGLIGIILTTRHQRAITELGAQREVEDRLRDERRETFVNYLTACQDMYGALARPRGGTRLGFQFHASNVRLDPISSTASGPPRAIKI